MTIPFRQRSGYCTNVHAGRDLATAKANLERYAVAVKQAVSPTEPMGVGLWFSAPAARQLRESGQLSTFAEWLAQVGLVPFTFNAFPYGDFHQDVVKHRVYHPTWADPARLEYTRDVIAIQDACLPAGMEGSISTLPIAWGSPPEAELQASVMNLTKLASHLAELEARTGRLIYVCLEPEPGCVLDTASDVACWFERLGHERHIRRHLRVCHDICHSAVMFESQADALAAYRKAGVTVGKVQVSSAVKVDFGPLTPDQRREAFAQLQAFDEKRYLHQTVIRDPGQEPVFFEDLPLALQTASDPGNLRSEWRTHFHVPIYLADLGKLRSSRGDIEECLRHLSPDVRHFEVETYAWGVLPASLAQPDLALGIAQEMRWLWLHNDH